jgi:hypothetical protein
MKAIVFPDDAMLTNLQSLLRTLQTLLNFFPLELDIGSFSPGGNAW